MDGLDRQELMAHHQMIDSTDTLYFEALMKHWCTELLRTRITSLLSIHYWELTMAASSLPHSPIWAFHAVVTTALVQSAVLVLHKI